MTMTLDEAVAIFERELPGWCWKVCQCGISADAWAVPDYSVAGAHDDLETDEALAFIASTAASMSSCATPWSAP